MSFALHKNLIEFFFIGLQIFRTLPSYIVWHGNENRRGMLIRFRSSRAHFLVNIYVSHGTSWNTLFFWFFCRHNTRRLCICGSAKIILITIRIKKVAEINAYSQAKASVENRRSWRKETPERSKIPVTTKTVCSAFLIKVLLYADAFL